MSENLINLCLVGLLLLTTPFILVKIRSLRRKKNQQLFNNAIEYNKIPTDRKFYSKGFKNDVNGNQYFIIENRVDSSDRLCVIPPSSTKLRGKFKKEVPVRL